MGSVLMECVATLFVAPLVRLAALVFAPTTLILILKTSVTLSMRLVAMLLVNFALSV